MSWYRSGTVSVVAGSKVVAGTGTDFITYVTPGAIFFGPDGRAYEVDTITAAGSMSLVTPYAGAAANNAAYSVAPTQAYIVALAQQVASLLGTFSGFRDDYLAGNLVGAGLELKGILASPAQLPAAGNSDGDAYMIAAVLYVWAKGAWQFGSIQGPKGDVGDANPLTLQAAVDAQAAQVAAAASALSASNSAATALTSQTSAAGSATAAAANLATARNAYYGSYTADPATRPDASARQAGDRYYNSVAKEERTFNGTIWYVPNLSAAGLAAPGGGAQVGNTPAGGVTAGTQQGAINELDAKKAALSQVQNGSYLVGVASGNANAITLALTPAFPTLAHGAEIRFKALGANTLTSVSLKVDASAAAYMSRPDGTPLAIGDIPYAGCWVYVVYDSVLGKWVLQNPAFPVNTAIIASSINGGALSGIQNRIINGDMSIDQRNAGAAVTLAVNGSAYTIDRWGFQNARTNGSTLVIQRVAVANPVISGMAYALKITNTTAGAVGASDAVALWQGVEGFNTADLLWGTPAAKPVTVAFAVTSSLAGNYAVGIRGGGGAGRSYVAHVNVASANVEQIVSVTIPGDTSGTWAVDNQPGLWLSVDLGIGSTYSTASLGTWLAGNAFGSTTGVKLSTVAGATLQITAVRLVPGTVVPPMEPLPYSQRLAMCHRYCEVSASQENLFSGSVVNGGAYYSIVKFAAGRMRAVPTMTWIDGVNFNFPAGAPASAGTVSASGAQCFKTANGAGTAYFTFGFIASAEL
jgi:hypothetical protein